MSDFFWRRGARKSISVATLASCLLIGCSTPGKFGMDPELKVVQMASLPTPTREDAVTGNRPYYIGPNDKLRLGVFGIEGLEDIEVQVDASGKITFPIVGLVEVGGKTIAEVQRELQDRLRENYVRDPQVTVNLKETTERVVTIDGQVDHPGSYPVIGSMSLLRAIAIAGSTSEFARLKDVVVFREVDGQRYAALYNLAAIRRGNYADPELFANDVVVVGDSKSRRLFKDILQVVPLFTTPIVLLLR